MVEAFAQESRGVKDEVASEREIDDERQSGG